MQPLFMQSLKVTSGPLSAPFAGKRSGILARFVMPGRRRNGPGKVR
ncbi:hypothetical protein C4K09_1531 [Pseudomonas chlororaphis subsp. aureofaciens]|nr:hypothetical protein C4K09_1531 [Pseudomonas chlororaphis subsp. aureofaciens]